MDHLLNGDDYLSGFDRKMWSLCYATLEKFQCPTMFKISGPDARNKIDQHIKFFVPAGHPRCNEVVEFLKYELKDEEKEAEDNETVHMYFWGIHVTICEYGGLEGYLDKDICDEMSKDAAKEFFRRCEELKQTLNKDKKKILQ